MHWPLQDNCPRPIRDVHTNESSRQNQIKQDSGLIQYFDSTAYQPNQAVGLEAFKFT
jgi:hypothetical protein